MLSDGGTSMSLTFFRNKNGRERLKSTMVITTKNVYILTVEKDRLILEAYFKPPTTI